jgi:hypothetical protein
LLFGAIFQFNSLGNTIIPSELWQKNPLVFGPKMFQKSRFITSNLGLSIKFLRFEVMILYFWKIFGPNDCILMGSIEKTRGKKVSQTLKMPPKFEVINRDFLI